MPNFVPIRQGVAEILEIAAQTAMGSQTNVLERWKT